MAGHAERSPAEEVGDTLSIKTPSCCSRLFFAFGCLTA
jgi:hypothetical protein